ncbi:MAG: hypothetical protein JO167_02060, partial [Alphaproteobacteria bacterium]|nr:hypothetical protein [Alphaproteobacteria bacterium]
KLADVDAADRALAELGLLLREAAERRGLEVDVLAREVAVLALLEAGVQALVAVQADVDVLGGEVVVRALAHVGLGLVQIADADLRVRVADHMMDAAAMRLTVQRMQDEAKSNQGPSAVTSIMKNANVKVNQTRAELLIEIMGFQGLGWEGESFSENEINATRNWLSGKAQSIYGGSNEIQSNIIAKRILGLLDHQ